MLSVLDTSVFWVTERGGRTLVLVPSDTRMPTLVTRHEPLLRAHYLSPSDVEIRVQNFPGNLHPSDCRLLVWTGDSEAPPAKTALLFLCEGKETVVANIGGNGKRVDTLKYRAARKSAQSWSWNSDISQGRFGYLQVGGSGMANLWRVRRSEADVADRLILTLNPVLPANGMPTLDLTSIENLVVKNQIEQSWREFVEMTLRPTPMRAANAAREICEYLLREHLKPFGVIKDGKGEFGDSLEKLFTILRGDDRAKISFNLLHFHLMQKIRLLHGGNHAARTEREGPVSLDLTVNVTADLIEVLRAAGLVKAGP